MDLIKIGKYIAGKRKDLRMTQKQLAEKLGMRAFGKNSLIRLIWLNSYIHGILKIQITPFMIIKIKHILH